MLLNVGFFSRFCLAVWIYFYDFYDKNKLKSYNIKISIEIVEKYYFS